MTPFGAGAAWGMAPVAKLGETSMAFGRFFSRTIPEPRRAPRIKRAFDIATSADGGRTFRRALPVDISSGGIGMLAADDIPEDFVLTMRLERKSIRARVRKVSSTLGTLKGRIAWRIGARFTNVTTDDLEMIERFVHRVPARDGRRASRRLADAQAVARRRRPDPAALGRARPASRRAGEDRTSPRLSIPS